MALCFLLTALAIWRTNLKTPYSGIILRQAYCLGLGPRMYWYNQHGFSEEGFEQIPGSRQAVRTTGIKFEDTKVILETTDIEDLMKNGLQIFLMNEDIANIEEDFFEIYHAKADGLLCSLYKEGRVRWINDEREINPNSQLRAEFNPQSFLNTNNNKNTLSM